jgi:hypothetical protein
MKTDQALSAKRHGKFAFFSVWLLQLFFAGPSAYAQLTVTLNLAPELRNARILRVSDFNITGSGSVSQLFNVIITNASSNAIDAYLQFQLARDGRPIVVATSRPFSVPPIPQTLTLTYPDLRRGGTADFDDTAIQALTDAILQTGRLLSGAYVFTVRIFNANPPVVEKNRAETTLTIFNPTSLDLISPGAPVGNSECVQQFGLLPQFKWNSNADRFLITVCEVLPTNSSPEDVMQNEPRLQRILQRGTDFWGSPSFIYPSGSLPLQFGKTYYWQVQALIASPSGEVRLPSEIWCFQINSINNPGGSMAIQQLLNLLGSSDLEALFAEGGPLYGYNPTGAVSLNGRRIELSELLNILRTQPIKTLSVQVE